MPKPVQSTFDVAEELAIIAADMCADDDGTYEKAGRALLTAALSILHLECISLGEILGHAEEYWGTLDQYEEVMDLLQTRAAASLYATPLSVD